MAATINYETPTYPLTTLFSPPQWCTDLPYTYAREVSGTAYFKRNAKSLDEGTASACYPPAFDHLKKNKPTGIYSPGVCPSGWTGTDAGSHDDSATRVMCCPSEMPYIPHLGCTTLIPTPTLVVLDSKHNLTMTTPFIAIEWPIPIAWASSDLHIFTPASAPITTAAPSPMPSKHLELRELLQIRDDNNSTSSSLSTGEKAGIGVGVGAAAVLGITAAIVLVLRRRKSKEREEVLPEISYEPVSSSGYGGEGSVGLGGSGSQGVSQNF